MTNQNYPTNRNDSHGQELFKEIPKFVEYSDKHLLEKMNAQLTVFHLAMQRVGAEEGYDPLTSEEAEQLCLFWHDLEPNIRVLMELFNYANKKINDSEYDPDQPGRYLWYKSIISAFEEMQEA